jgi:hypothetical protein
MVATPSEWSTVHRPSTNSSDQIKKFRDSQEMKSVLQSGLELHPQITRHGLWLLKEYGLNLISSSVVCLSTLLLGLYSVDWQDDWRITNCRGCGTERSLPNSRRNRGICMEILETKKIVAMARDLTGIRTQCLENSQSQSHITTDSQSASPSWCQAPIWDPRPIFLSPWDFLLDSYCLLFCSALSDERTGL